MVDRKYVEDLVRNKLTRAIKKRTIKQPHDFVNEALLLEQPENSKIFVTAKAIITPSARDLADQFNISFQVISQVPIADMENITAQTIIIGTDHGGFSLKEVLKKNIKDWGYAVYDVGTHSTDSVDYPDFAFAVVSIVGSGHAKRGIIIDGAGIGSAMVANKVGGVRAAHCHNLFEINNSREHNDANVLTLGARVIGEGLAIDMVKTWLSTDFAGGRHQKRVDKIMAVERREIKCRT